MRLATGLAAGVGALALMAGSALAEGYKAPRIGGRPDLSGDWSIAWLTRMERGKDFKTLTIPEAEAVPWEAKNANKINQPDDVVGQEDSEFPERGDKLARIRGTVRTSWIYDPVDGKIPWRKDVAAWRKAQREAWEKTAFDHVEQRPFGDRCLGPGSGGPPIHNGPDLNELRFVQTPEHLAILPEYMAMLRVVPLSGDPTPSTPVWGGHSQVRWEGETLVVTTTAFHPLQFQGPKGSVSDTHKVTERFTRTGPDELSYAFEVENPQLYSQRWRGEMVMRRGKGLHEYACHEGNYALPGILAGGQRMLAEAAAEAKAKAQAPAAGAAAKAEAKPANPTAAASP